MIKLIPGADGTGFDAVLKVGGSLERGQGLERLCQEIARLGRTRRLLVIPGGGVFADQVRSAYRAHSLSETAAHRMALLAMDQYGLLLAERIPGALASADILSARQAVAQGRAAVLLPSALINHADPAAALLAGSPRTASPPGSRGLVKNRGCWCC